MSASDMPMLVKKQSSSASAGKTTRYTKDQILQIYKSLGNFKSPMIDAEKNGVNPENLKFLDSIINKDPNVVLESLKDLPPAQGDKVRCSLNMT